MDEPEHQSSRTQIRKELSLIEAEDIMIPRSEVVLLNGQSSFREILDLIISDGHSRFPVYSEKIDNIIGILYAKSLLNYFQLANSVPFDINNYLKKPLFISENKKADELLTEFKNTHIHMAIVVDEYGTIQGIITMEDILEEIVGEINDEFDKEEEANFTVISESETTILPRMTIEEFNKLFKTRIHSDDYETIGGFIINHFGYVPKFDESFTYGRYEFIIKEAEGSKIRKVLIKRA